MEVIEECDSSENEEKLRTFFETDKPNGEVIIKF